MQFDSRARILSTEIQEHWEDRVKENWRENKEKLAQGLIHEFGAWNAELKRENFVSLGAMPFSVLAFHNAFLYQARSAFVIEAYYPALTGACALGERILNHLIIRLRDHYSSTPEYKRVYKKGSFDNWDLAIETLNSWGVLLPDVTEKYRELASARHRAIHFNPDTDRQARKLGLHAVTLLQEIVQEQFGSIGKQPWFIPKVKGASFLRKNWEDNPFVKEVYIPNATLVGPHHKLEMDKGRWVVVQDGPYDEEGEVSDEEFRRMYNGDTDA